MNKRVALFVIGAFTALALTALPNAASARETKLKCEGSGSCTFTSVSGHSRWWIFGGDEIACEASSGNGEAISLNAEREVTTDSVQLLYTGCKEQNTIFHFACSNTATSGNITTNVMTTHFIALPGLPTEAGVVKTNAGVTFTCAGGFASTQMTGSMIGEFETKCGTNTSTVQKIKSVNGPVYTGTTFELEGKTSHTSGGSYAKAEIESTTTMTFNQNVILTCV